MTLRRLVLTRIAFRILAALAVLYALLQVLDLLDTTDEVLDRGLGVSGIFYYALLRTPRLITQALPIAVLAGGLFGFSQLARENAVTAMRTVGVSVYGILALAVPAALVAVLLQIALEQWVTPAADAAMQEWWLATAPPEDAKDEGDARSFRVGNDIVTASAGALGGTILLHPRIYRRDQDGHLTQRLTADSARYKGPGWTLTDVQTVSVGETRAEIAHADTLDWATTLEPADVVSTYGDSVNVSPAEARRALNEGAALHAPAFYEMRLQRAWAGPFASLVMLLLAAPVALANFRGGSGTTAVAIALGTGMLFLVIDGLLTAIGESGAAPVPLAAWAGPVIFSALGLTILLRKEG